MNSRTLVCVQLMCVGSALVPKACECAFVCMVVWVELVQHLSSSPCTECKCENAAMYACVCSLPEEDEDMNGSGGHGQAMPWVSMVTPVSVISGRKPWSPVMAYNHLNTTGVGPTTNLTRFQSLSDLRLTEEDVKRRRSVSLSNPLHDALLFLSW